MSLKARHLFYYAAALLACAQWPLLHKTGFVPGPPWEALFPGLAVLGAAFLLSWAAEAAEMDIPQGVSVTLLALIAVLPEYAVDMYFAWKAGKDPAYTAYACANMTGANRLLIGLGWAAVLFVYAAAHKKKQIELDPAVSPELVTLGLATLYAFLIPLKSTLSLLDFVVFLALFGVYAYRVSIAEVHEPELEGPAATIGALSGEVKIAVGTMASFAQHHKSGKLRVIGVLAPKRLASHPNLAILVESGFPELTTASWQGIFVPKGTPRPIVDKLHAALMKVLDDKAVNDRFAQVSAVTIANKSPEEFAAFMKIQTDFWGGLIKKLNVPML